MAEKKADRSKEGKYSSKQGTMLVHKADIQRAAAMKEWLAGLPDDVGARVMVTLDMALKAFAEARGFKAMSTTRVR